MRDDVATTDTPDDQVTPSRLCGKRRAATEALQNMNEWTSVLRRPPEDVEN